jgi:hypothetical protein
LQLLRLLLSYRERVPGGSQFLLGSIKGILYSLKIILHPDILVIALRTAAASRGYQEDNQQNNNNQPGSFHLLPPSKILTVLPIITGKY